MHMLRHYIRAKVILAVLSLVYCSIAMLFLRYPHALALPKRWTSELVKKLVRFG
jgi:hypothetical protein